MGNITTREFTEEELEELDLPYSIPDNEQVLDHNYKYTSYWHGVFELDGSHWMIEWHSGANSYDEVETWEEFPVTAVKVVKVPVVKYEWVPVINE